MIKALSIVFCIEIIKTSLSQLDISDKDASKIKVIDFSANLSDDQIGSKFSSKV